MTESVYATIPELAVVLGVEEETVRRVLLINDRNPGTISTKNGEYCVSDYVNCAYVGVTLDVLCEIEEVVRVCRVLKEVQVPPSTVST